MIFGFPIPTSNSSRVILIYLFPDKVFNFSLIEVALIYEAAYKSWLWKVYENKMQKKTIS